MPRTPVHGYTPWGGITRAELAAGLRAAAKGAARNGNAAGARELRERAKRASASVMPAPPRRWPWDVPVQRVRLEKSIGAIRRAKQVWREHWQQEARERAAHTKALRLGGRTLLAMTCMRCGKFLAGEKFKRHSRNAKDKIEYIDRRCVNCKWGHRVNGKRGDRNA